MGTLVLIVTAALIILFQWLPSLRFGLNTADEGYLLFGVQQCLKGKVPIRDFRAYDPGRYYFCASALKPFKANFISLRAVMSIPMFLTMTMGSTLIYQATENLIIAMLTSVFVWSCSRPYYKAFEKCFCVVTVISCVIILQGNSPLAFFCVGIFLGLCIFFGINLALYAALSFSISFVIRCFTHTGPLIDVGINIILGALIGLLPTVYMAIHHQGFLAVYWQKKILTVLHRKSSNLPLPVPWLWRKYSVETTQYRPYRKRAFRVVVTLLPFFYIGSFIFGLFLPETHYPESSLLVASAVVGMPYLQHLYSRCEIDHLTTSIHPALLAMSVLIILIPFSLLQLIVALMTLLALFSLTWKLSEYSQYLKRPYRYVYFESTQGGLWIKKKIYQKISWIGDQLNTHCYGQKKSLFLPRFPAFYPLFNKEPVSYDIFCVYPASTEQQQKMISDIVNYQPNLIFVDNCVSDQREELRFQNTHHHVWSYIQHNFIRQENATGLPEDLYLWIRKASNS